VDRGVAVTGHGRMTIDCDPRPTVVGHLNIGAMKNGRVSDSNPTPEPPSGTHHSDANPQPDPDPLPNFQHHRPTPCLNYAITASGAAAIVPWKRPNTGNHTETASNVPIALPSPLPRYEQTFNSVARWPPPTVSWPFGPYTPKTTSL